MEISKTTLHSTASLIKIVCVTIAWLMLSVLPCLGTASHGPHEACSEFFEDLELAVEEAGVRGAAASGMSALPFLRTNRFLNEMRYFVSSREEQDQWLGLLANEGRRALTKEVQNLPDKSIDALVTHLPFNESPRSPQARRDAVKEAALNCTDEALAQSKKNLRRTTIVLMNTEIPPEYRRPRKALGLYPLFTLPIGTAIAHYRGEVIKGYAVPLDRLDAQGMLNLFAPIPSTTSAFQGVKVEALLDAASKNPLGIPLLALSELEEIFYRYAPLIEQDVTGPYDLPGAIEWKGPLISVDTNDPALYYYPSYMILRGSPLLQLNYVLWYKKRPKVSLVDIEAGRIHAMTIRMTLDPRGVLIMTDMIHNCGCYHFFFPSKTTFKGPKINRFRENAFSPQWLPPFQPESRLTVRIGPKKHFVQRVFYAREDTSAQRAYRLIPYEQLESLPRKSGIHESIFTPRGLVKGKTQRPERFLLYSVGIPEIGSMRQRGHHATALIGERHFDDPRLFEKYFYLQENATLR